MHNTFLLYTGEDESLAKRVYVDLLKGGVRPWATAYDFAPGSPYEPTLEAAMDASTHVALLVTRAYYSNDVIQRLANKALNSDKTIVVIEAERGADMPDVDSDPIRLRRYARGIQSLVQALPHDDEPIEELHAFQRANDAYFKDDQDAAIMAYKEIENPSPLVLNSLGAAYTAAGRYDEALEVIDQAIEQVPDNAQFYRNKSVALTGAKRIEESLAADEKALELEPDSPENYSSYAMTLVVVERYDDALKAIQKAQALVPDSLLYIYQEGFIHSQAKDYEAAIAAFDRAIEIEPHYEGAVAGRRIALGHLGRHEEALAEVNKEIKKHPKKGSGYITRSLINFYIGQYEDAAQDATAALTRSAEHQVAGLFNRAIAYWKLDRKTEAQQDFLKAIEQMPILGTAEGIEDNAESDLTADAALGLLQSMIDDGLIPDA